MGLAEAYTAVNEERVVAGSRIIGNGLRGGMGELVACPADKGFKGIFGI